MYMRGKPHRTAKLQVMVSDSVRARVELEAGRLGLSISSFMELVIGQYLSNRGSQNLVNEKVV
jgi:hypothetical protein